MEDSYQLGLSANDIGALGQVLEQELVLGQPLHRLQQVGAQWQSVTSFLLAVVQYGRAETIPVMA